MTCPDEKYKCTPLTARDGHMEIVKVLLAHTRVVVNQASSDDGVTPLFMACYCGHTEIVKLLLAHTEIDANKAEDDGATLLFVACQEEHAAIVKLLLTVGLT